MAVRPFRKDAMDIKRFILPLSGAILSMSLGLASPALAAGKAETRPDQSRFLEIYKALVETDTSVDTGSCTVLSDRIEKRLKAGGFTDAEIYRFTPGDFPKGEGLVVSLPGRSKTAKAILLLGHLDVVNAPPEGWTHDPFKFVEEGGVFYGRGVDDMKALDAVWIDTLLRLKARGAPLNRTLKMALTCGEEGGWPFNGARWLSENKRDLIDAEFALNEGGGGDMDADGRIHDLTVGAAEKYGPNFKVEAMNPGGHSSVPRADNAIYDLSRALLQISSLHFPAGLNDVTRAFFASSSIGRNDKYGQAMRAIVTDPKNKTAEDTLSEDVVYNALLHTTCVPTLLSAGHATNALPQVAAANVNCRILPGETTEQVKTALVKAVGDPKISVTLVPNDEPVSGMSPVSRKVFGPMEQVAKKHFPDVGVVPTMSTGGSDTRYLRAVGIPTYGVPGIVSPLGGSGAHGINEHIGVQAVYAGRDYLFDLVQTYLEQE